MKRKLRCGYTTGACAAAASKAAVLAMLTGLPVAHVDIPLPDGSRAFFHLFRCEVSSSESGVKALASVIKDGGDDPDVTNGAEVVAVASRGSDHHIRPQCIRPEQGERIVICGGIGIGIVTKRGLGIKVGEPAINPVPRIMIKKAVAEAISSDSENNDIYEIVISVPEGERLAMKTLNQRLGIIGGISILGTTGIVTPISADAWTDTIRASMNVARKSGLKEIVISTGRTSEKAVQTMLGLPDEAFVMMGDHLAFSLKEASRQNFAEIHLAAMWAKIMKAAMKIPQTHVRHGALIAEDAAQFLLKLGIDERTVRKMSGANTAREIHERLFEMGRSDVIGAVCLAAKQYAEKISGIPVRIYLVSASGKVEYHV